MNFFCWLIFRSALIFACLVVWADFGFGQAQTDRINSLIEKKWVAYEIEPSKEATDGEWCRRAFLDLIGRIPTVDEYQAFRDNKSLNKKSELVNQLIYSTKYADEFVRNWSTIWSNLLIGRTGGNRNNSLISRTGMRKYLEDSITENKRYNTFVRELVTASGTTKPGSREFNGATNFLIEKVRGDNAVQATSKTSQLFLGLQIQCTQCHNHPFNEWKQQTFWEMNAFFRQSRAFRPDESLGEKASSTLADQDFRGQNRDMEDAAIFYEMRNGLVKVAYPVFVDGSKIETSGYVNVVNRREELADLLVQSEYFPKAIVNRMFSHFLGYGLTQKIDDLGPHVTVSHPQLLDYLAEEFVKEKYDLKQLMAWIVLSKPYGLSSSITKGNEKDSPATGEFPKFSRFYLRQIQAESLYESLVIATNAGSQSDDPAKEARIRNRWLQQFSSAFGNDEGDEMTTFDGTIPQTLMMFNGGLIRSATSVKSGSLLNDLAANTQLKDNEKVTYLFEAGLSRKPTRKELIIARNFFRTYPDKQVEALKDIWWVILNTNEFILNH